MIVKNSFFVSFRPLYNIVMVVILFYQIFRNKVKVAFFFLLHTRKKFTLFTLATIFGCCTKFLRASITYSILHRVFPSFIGNVNE